MSIVSILEEKLSDINGDSEVVFLHMLVEVGICPSTTAAKKLLISGRIPFLRIGNKILFAKKDFINFLRKSSSEKEGNFAA